MIRATHVLIIFCFTILLCNNATAQESNLYSSSTTLQKRSALYQNLIKSIKRNLSYPLKTEFEDKWTDAFASIELLQYKSDQSNKRIQDAFDSIGYTSDEFKIALIELGSAVYPGKYIINIRKLLTDTQNPTVFAYGSANLLKSDISTVLFIREILQRKFNYLLSSNILLNRLTAHIEALELKQPDNSKKLAVLFSKNFLPGAIVQFSIQRPNRDYPGVAIIRKADGTFIKDSTGTVVVIPQLARSITNMPYYLHYGNTPQGIYKMNGFGVSMGSFIGPTPNVQLQMPNEIGVREFFNDSLMIDTIWTTALYERLLPGNLKNDPALMESYYAGAAGRSEIICHGTTINPDYYYGKPYFPHTPSEGCLTTFEAWNGKRYKSNQQLLINALLQAGGGHGYCVVINLADEERPVTIEDILPLTNAAEKK